MLNWKKRKVGEWCWLHDPHMKERRPVKVLEVIEKNGIDWLCEWATLSMQSYDQKKSKVNTSGRTGVSQVKQTGRWVASIKKNGITTVVYRGDSFEAACEARTKAEIEYFGFSKE